MNDIPDLPPAPPMGDDESATRPLVPRPWIVLQNAQEVETWIEEYNRELQAAVFFHKINAVNSGQGIRFALELGGDIYLHTTSEGQVLLDVSEEAAWAAPVISAATHVTPPAGSVWVLPHDTLTQLVLGLSTLIATSEIVLTHEFRLGKSNRIQF